MPEEGPGARVRVASPSDLYAAHAFLPWIGHDAVPHDAVVVAQRDGAIVGAGAFSALQTANGLRAEIVVHAGFRRQGLGRALLDLLAEIARTWGAQSLRSWRPSDDGATLAFADRVGARACSRLLTFEAGAQALSFGRRLGRRAIAATAALRPLQATDLPVVTAAYAAHFGELSAPVSQGLRALLADPAAQAISMGYERAGRLRAFVLFRIGEAAPPQLEFWYAEPSVRGTIPLALIAAAAEAGERLGHRGLRFQCRDDARSSLRLARELALEPVRVEVSHELAL